MPIVYVLTNPAMPGLVKIGYTAGEDANTRIDQLFNTSVPFPFKLEFACRVPIAQVVERALHKAFGPQRVSPNREFFRIEPSQAIAILELLHVDDATKEVNAQPSAIAEVEREAVEEFKQRRPIMNFERMGIPVDAELVSTIDGSIAKVNGSRWVSHNGKETSLSAATKELLNVVYAVNPGPYWTYHGRTISEIYNETYPAVE